MNERPLKILVGADVPCDPDSGAAGTVYQTNQALRSLGHEVDEIWADDLGRRIRHGNLHYLLELPYRYRALVRQRCKTNRYDVIQLSQPHAYLAARDHYGSGRPSVFVNRSHGLELRVEHVLPFWEKEYGFNQKNRIKKAFSAVVRHRLNRHWHLVARFADGVILPSEDDRNFLLNATGMEADRAITVHHGVSAPLFRKPSAPAKRADRSRKLLYIGQYTFMKGPDVLCEVANRLFAAHPDASLTWVCSENDHQKVLDKINPAYRSRVQLPGWMPQPELAELYASHGIFIFPSFFEGAGKAALEAMASGMCVVASDTGGMRDYIQSGVSGWLVDVGDIEGFQSAIGQVIGNDLMVEQIGARAAEDAGSYTWRSCAEKSVKFYKSLLTRKREIRLEH